MSTDDSPVFEGNTITIWREWIEEEKEFIYTVRVGLTTIQMPKSVFLELQGGCNEAYKKITENEKLT